MYSQKKSVVYKTLLLLSKHGINKEHFLGGKRRENTN